MAVLVPRVRSRGWCGTLNNYTEEEYGNLLSYLQSDGVTYGVVGKESGEGGTPHLQFYLYLASPKSLLTVKNGAGVRCHLERQRGNNKQASDYCKKDGDFVEFGRLPAGQGHRSDLSAVVETAKEVDTLDELVERHPEAYMKYHSGIQATFKILKRPRVPEVRYVETFVFHGEPRTGKDLLARACAWELQEKACTIQFKFGSKWFDGYNYERVLILGEFDHSTLKINELKNVLDGQPQKLNIKYGSCEANWNIVFITTNSNPLDWYPNEAVRDKLAVNERLTVVEEFTEGFTSNERLAFAELPMVEKYRQTLAANRRIADRVREGWERAQRVREADLA